MNSCIFCLEGGDTGQALLHNVKCRCNFCFHMPCYELYDRKTVCPMCRSVVGELFEPTIVVPVEVVVAPPSVVQVGTRRRPVRNCMWLLVATILISFIVGLMLFFSR